MADLEPYTFVHFHLHRKQYLDRDEAERRIGVSERTIKRYVAAGLRVYESATGRQYVWEPDLLAMYRSKLKANSARRSSKR